MKKYTKVLAIFLSLLLVLNLVVLGEKTEKEYFKILNASNDERFDATVNPKINLTDNSKYVGHANVIDTGEPYDKVISIGNASGDNEGETVTSNPSQVNIENSADNNMHMCFEFSLCVVSSPEAKRLALIKRNSGADQPELFCVDGKYFCSGTGKYEYTEDKWYTISVEVQLEETGQESYYSVSVIDGETVTPLSTKVAKTLTTTTWRFSTVSGNKARTDYDEFYLDNFKFYNMVEKPADYVAPDVSITADKGEYYYGETANLTISPQGNYLKNTTVYVNDVKIGTYTDAVINIPYTPAAAGTYKVKAVTENNYGITAEKEYSLTVNANENPTVSFQGIDSAVTFEEGDDMTLTVNADDDIEISKTELYVEGEPKKTVYAETLSYNFSQLQLGYGTYEVEAKAYDKYGLTASKKISVTIQPENYTSPTVSISADSYSAVCGGTVTLSVSADGSHFEAVDIYVNDEFQQSYTEKEFDLNVTKLLDGDYKVKAVAKDTIGKEATDEKTVTFNLPDGYIAPSVTLSASGIAAKKLGEALSANVTVSGSHWTDVDVYINGALYKNYEQASFNVSYTPDSAGTYKIKAVAKDEFNKSDEKEITFTVSANDAPTVSFDGIENGGVVNYEYDAAKLLNVAAADSDGIEKLEIYVDGVLKATVSSEAMQLDFDTLGLGLGSFNLKAVAYDSYGLSGEAEITLTVTSSIKTQKEQNSNFTADITLAEVRGHARVGTVDTAHGKSVILGMAEGEDNATVNYSRADISVGGYSHVEFKFDVCVMEKPTAKGMTLTMRTEENGSAKAFPELFVVNANNFTSGGGSFAYDTEKWYTISVEADTANGWYSTKVIDGGEETVLSSFAPFDFGTFSLWRFHTGTNTSDYYEIAVDNFKFYEIITAPSVVSIGYDDENSATEIPSSAQKINVVLDGALTAEDINADNVKLMKGAQEIKAKRVQYSSESNTVSIVLDGALESATDYSIVFDENIRISGTTVLGDKIIASFKTAPSGAEIEGITWKAKKDNSADLSFTAKNLALDEVSEEYDDVPVCCIVTLWDSVTGRFVKAYADNFTLSEAAKIHSINVPNGALYKAEVYFSNSFTAPQIYEVADFAK